MENDERAKGLKELLDAEAALTHVAAFGWERPKKEKLFSAKIKQDSSVVKHDPNAIAKLKVFLNETSAISMAYSERLPGMETHGHGRFLRIYQHLFEHQQDKLLRSLDKQLMKIAMDTNGWLVDRQIQILGCNPPDDCHTIDRVCGHASMKGCGLKRK